MICSFKKMIYPKSAQTASDNGYTIALYGVLDRLIDSAGNRISEAKVVGYYLPTNTGLNYEMTGNWGKTKYGIQFECQNFREIIQPGKAGIVAYLSSGLLKGIGKKTAEKMYDMFGDQTLEILESKPDEFLKISGINKNKLEHICNSYLASRGARDIVAYWRRMVCRPTAR